MTRSNAIGVGAYQTVALFVFLAGVLALAAPAEAYIGPGAGFALLSSFLVLFTTIILAAFSLLILPFRFLLRLIMRKSRPKPWIERLIVVGFDGQDPKITERLMKEGWSRMSSRVISRCSPTHAGSGGASRSIA